MESLQASTQRLLKRLAFATWVCRGAILTEVGICSWLIWLFRHEQVALARRVGYPILVVYVLLYIVLGRVRIFLGKKIEETVTFSSDEAREHFVTHLTHVTAPLLLTAVAGGLLLR